MTENEKNYVASVLDNCLECAYRGGDSETQEQIERCINIVKGKDK